MSKESRFTFNMSEADARRVHEIVKDRRDTIKNWIASQVESDNIDRAKELVKDLRQLDRIFASFNVEAKMQITEANGREVERDINVI